jgi:hypothetical protein
LARGLSWIELIKLFECISSIIWIQKQAGRHQPAMAPLTSLLLAPRDLSLEAKADGKTMGLAENAELVERITEHEVVD